MGRRSGGGRWASASLTSCPIRPRPPKSPAEVEADMLRWEAMADDMERRAAAYARHKASRTPEQVARKNAQDDTRRLRALVRRAVDAVRWARIEGALDGPWAFEYNAKADALRAKVTQRTAAVYAKAAAGCEVSAAYLADAETDALHAAVLESCSVGNGRGGVLRP